MNIASQGMNILHGVWGWRGWLMMFLLHEGYRGCYSGSGKHTKKEVVFLNLKCSSMYHCTWTDIIKPVVVVITGSPTTLHRPIKTRLTLEAQTSPYLTITTSFYCRSAASLSHFVGVRMGFRTRRTIVDVCLIKIVLNMHLNDHSNLTQRSSSP